MSNILASRLRCRLAAALTVSLLVLALAGTANAQSSGSSGGCGCGGNDPGVASTGDGPTGGDPASVSIAGVITGGVAEIGGLMGDTGERVIIIDVRPRADFAKRHLKNAKNLPVRYSEVLRDHVFDKAALGGDKAARIVVYGAGANDPAAAAVIRHAINEGYSNVIWMRGGFAEWLAARLPASES